MRNALAPLVTLIFPLLLFGKTVHNGLPVVKATASSANYRIGNRLFQGRWRISPPLSPDILTIRPQSDSTQVAFYTDQDSIVWKAGMNDSVRFYVLLRDSNYALTELKVVPYEVVHYDSSNRESLFRIKYEHNADNEYLKTLREKYGLRALIKDSKEDAEKASRILHWVHQRWQHNGSNEPRKNDALSILEEAKEGKNFRCVEYSIVTTACLNAVGLKARTVALKTREVETTQSGAGHVAVEVFLRDIGKWAFVDGQWDVMPVLDGIPLNAVELQEGIARHSAKLEIRSYSDVDREAYMEWIYPYLYYLDMAFDNTETNSGPDFDAKGKSRLMLVPVGAKEPTVFQIQMKIENCYYTNVLADFYGQPTD